MTEAFWRGKRVLITGHTGFKGSWLTLWLSKLGARVTGCALPPEDRNNLFESASVAQDVEHHICDIREPEPLHVLVVEAQPDIVIHMAAQSLVRRSYRQPVDTYLTNVLGTMNLLEAVRTVDTVRSCVVVTTDKCYENKERTRPYQEHEPLGGFDPYSSSKACTEILTASYRRSFFSFGESGEGKTAIATARAGNVIGGGDWAEDRLIPDVMSAFSAGEVIRIRNPDAVRPWQYVLEPLYGYLMLAEKLFDEGSEFAEAWNFGPDDSSHLPVSALLERLVDLWGGDARWEPSHDAQPHEARLLALDSSKARQKLGWKPRTSLDETLRATVSWYRSSAEGKNTRRLCLDQIEAFERAAQR